MKHLFILFATVCLALTGCVDITVKIVLSRDLSGTATMQLEMLDQIYEMVKMQIERSGEDLSFFDEDALRARIEKDGGKLRKYVNSTEAGIRTVAVEIWFKDARVMAESTGEGQFTLKKDGDDWVWTMMDNEMGLAFQNMDQEDIEQQITLMTSTMTGMKWDLSIQVPELVATNMKKRNLKTVAFVMSYDDDIAGKSGKQAVEAFRGLMAPKWVRFKGVQQGE